jgi:hypothetical protein
MISILYAIELGYNVDEFGNVSYKGKKLKLMTMKDNYLFFNIKMYSESKRIKVHRLVAYQKFGKKIFENGIVVRHLDGNPQNNVWSNIEIGTHSDNMMDIPAEIRKKKAIHAASFLKKYNDAEVYNWYINNGTSYKNTMLKFNISSKGTLSYILNKFKQPQTA